MSRSWQIGDMAQSIRRSLVLFLAMLVLALGPAGVNVSFAADASQEMTGAPMASAHMHGPSKAMAVPGGDDCCSKGHSRSCPDCLTLRSCETACAVPAILAEAPSASGTLIRGRNDADADVLAAGMRVKPPTEPPKA